MPAKTYYQILQVDREASDEVIEVAYRRLARIYHPDVNKAPDALARMQEINAAYETLRDLVHRREYDAKLRLQQVDQGIADAYYGGPRRPSPPPTSSAAQPRQAPTDGPPWGSYVAPPVPIRCEGCGRSDGTLRVAVFPYVISLLIVTSRRAWSGVYCTDCRRAQMTKAKLITLAFGWWGIPWGPIWSIALLFNPREGRKPLDVNATYLAALGLHFLKQGAIQEGIEALEGSLRRTNDPKVAQLLAAARAYINGSANPGAQATTTAAGDAPVDGSPQRAAFERTRHRAAWAVMAAFALLVGLLLYGAARQPPPPQSVPVASPVASGSKLVGVYSTATPTVAPSPTPAPTPSQQVEVLGNRQRLREGPGLSYKRTTALGLGEQLTVIGQQDDCSWLKVETSNREVGWVRTSASGVSIPQDCASLPRGTFRARSMVLKPSGDRNAMGGLEINNDTTQDALIVVVAPPKHTVTSAYIRSGDTFLIPGIPDGTYIVYYGSGEEWDGAVFQARRSLQRFDEAFAYNSAQDGGLGWTITLRPFKGGNLGAENISAEDFPSIE